MRKASELGPADSGGGAPVEYARPGGTPPRVVGYGGAHGRVRRRFGKASDYPCARRCGARAQAWAYRHLVAPVERRQASREGYAYSTDPGDYMALCRRCHAELDAKFPSRPPSPAES